MAHHSPSGNAHGHTCTRESGTSTGSAVPVDVSYEYTSVSAFEFLGCLGVGTYGKVYKVKRRRDQAILVLKQVGLAGLTERDRADTLNECAVMRKANNHPHIIQYYSSFIEDSVLNIVMEFADGGDISQVISSHQKRRVLVEEQQIWRYLVEITLGLNHMHKHRILHRDIKPSNIFINKGRVRIGDLGLGKLMRATTRLAFSAVGTPLYFSPEVCEEKGYNEKSDIWSLGCVLYELMTFEPPFLASNQLALVKKIVGSKVPLQSLPEKYSLELRFLVAKMLEKNPKRRPDTNQILEYSPIVAHRHRMQKSASSGCREGEQPSSAASQMQKLETLAEEKQLCERELQLIKIKLQKSEAELEQSKQRERLAKEQSERLRSMVAKRDQEIANLAGRLNQQQTRMKRLQNNNSTAVGSSNVRQLRQENNDCKNTDASAHDADDGTDILLPPPRIKRQTVGISQAAAATMRSANEILNVNIRENSRKSEMKRALTAPHESNITKGRRAGENLDKPKLKRGVGVGDGRKSPGYPGSTSGSSSDSPPAKYRASILATKKKARASPFPRIRASHFKRNLANSAADRSVVAAFAWKRKNINSNNSTAFTSSSSTSSAGVSVSASPGQSQSPPPSRLHSSQGSPDSDKQRRKRRSPSSLSPSDRRAAASSSSPSSSPLSLSPASREARLRLRRAERRCNNIVSTSTDCMEHPRVLSTMVWDNKGKVELLTPVNSFMVVFKARQTSTGPASGTSSSGVSTPKRAVKILSSIRRFCVRDVAANTFERLYVNDIYPISDSTSESGCASNEHFYSIFTAKARFASSAKTKTKKYGDVILDFGLQNAVDEVMIMPFDREFFNLVTGKTADEQQQDDSMATPAQETGDARSSRELENYEYGTQGVQRAYSAGANNISASAYLSPPPRMRNVNKREKAQAPTPGTSLVDPASPPLKSVSALVSTPTKGRMHGASKSFGEDDFESIARRSSKQGHARFHSRTPVDPKRNPTAKAKIKAI